MKTKMADIKKFSSLREMVKSAAAEDKNKIAYKYRDGKTIKSVSYGDFYDSTSYLGTAIASCGFGKSHIAIIGENSYSWILTYLTVLLGDGVCVPVDKELPFDDIITVINHSDAEMVFYAKKYEKNFMERRDEFKNVKYFAGFDRTEDEGDVLSFNKLFEKGKAEYLSGNDSFEKTVSPDEALKLLVYTSGTTGTAKGVMLSQHNLVSSIYYGMRVSQVLTVGLSVLPYNHTYEAVCGILVGIHSRVTLCINSSLKLIPTNLKEFKPDYIYLVPAIVEMFYKKIWATAKKEKKDKALKFLIGLSNTLLKIGIDKRDSLFKSVRSAFGGNLKKIVCGGAPLRKEVGEFFESIGIVVLNGYGITECSPLVSVTQMDTHDYSTVGVPLECIEIDFDCPDNDGIGEIMVKGDIVMMGYYKRPELNAEVLKDGWFYTGDFGKFNEKGLLVITGRKKNLIVLSNGKNIFPEEIEDHIQAIPYVKEVVVFADRDENGLEDSLTAYVYLDEEQTAAMDDVSGSLKADIKAACDMLPVYKRITKTVISDTEFEKTTTNKIRRNKVIDKYFAENK